MPTLDEIFAAMPDADAEDAHEVLYIDPATRQIDVPDAEAILGVESDGKTERKYFACPRYVGAGIDLAACFLRVNYRNANNEVDAYLVEDAAVKGEYVTFSWELTRKVTGYKGKVQFIVCAILPGSDNTYPEWNTTLASGEVLEGLEPDGAAAEAATADVIAQLLALVDRQAAAVTAEGNTQIAAVQKAAQEATSAAQDTIAAKGAATLATIPEDYTTQAGQVDKLTRTTAGAIVCQAEGESIQVHDASDHHLAGLRIFGRSTQAGTPTPAAPVEIVSLPAPVVIITDGTEDNVQTLAITTPGSLPGIHVASGGNYTDANGQQWICDEVDLGRGVYVQRVKTVILNGSSAEAWTLYNNNPAQGTCFVYYPHDGVISFRSSLCDKYQNVNGCWGEPYREQMGIYSDHNSVSGRYFRPPIESVDSLEAWLAWLAENPLTFMYARATPVETALDDVTLAAFRELHSNKPTTTLLNDAGAYMVAEYVADTKLYIDRKLETLVAPGNA